MSRTYKDVSYKVKSKKWENEKGIKNGYKKGCIICETPQNRTMTITAVFKADEIKQKESFLEKVHDEGFVVREYEVFGYLESNPDIAGVREMRNRFVHKNKIEQYYSEFDMSRIVRKHPTYKSEFYGKEKHFIVFSTSVNADSSFISKKKNIFTIIDVTQEIVFYPRHFAHAYESYFRDNRYHCKCSWCRYSSSEDTNSRRTKDRKITAEIMKEFNSQKFHDDVFLDEVIEKEKV